MKDDLPVAARTVGLTLRFWEVRNAERLERVIAVLNNERPDGVYASGGRLIANN